MATRANGCKHEHPKMPALPSYPGRDPGAALPKPRRDDETRHAAEGITMSIAK
jgi:hypothetical protein